MRTHTSVGGWLSDRVCPCWHASNVIPPCSLLKITPNPTGAKTPSNRGTDWTKEGTCLFTRTKSQKENLTKPNSVNKLFCLLMTIKVLHKGFVVAGHWQKCGGVSQRDPCNCYPVIPGWRGEWLAVEVNTRSVCFEFGSSLLCVILNLNGSLNTHLVSSFSDTK